MRKLIYLLFIIVTTIACNPNERSEKADILTNNPQPVDTLIIRVGNNFDSDDERLKVDFYDNEGKIISSFINDSITYVNIKYNYDIVLNVVSLSEELHIEKIGDQKFKFKAHVDNIEYFETRPTISMAFIVDSTYNRLFYKYRDVIESEEVKFKEWYSEIDTVAIKTYQVKTL